jgi:hypothetical protein
MYNSYSLMENAMTVLTLITLASGLALAPIHATAQPATAHYRQARQTLNSLIAVAESRLRTQALERALSEGLNTFRTGFAHNMEAHAREQLVASRNPAALPSWITY